MPEKCILVTVRGDDGKTMSAKICGKKIEFKVIDKEAE